MDFTGPRLVSSPARGLGCPVAPARPRVTARSMGSRQMQQFMSSGNGSGSKPSGTSAIVGGDRTAADGGETTGCPGVPDAGTPRVMGSLVGVQGSSPHQMRVPPKLETSGKKKNQRMKSPSILRPPICRVCNSARNG